MMSLAVTAASVEEIANELNRRQLRFILVTEAAEGAIEMYADGNDEPSLTLIGALEQVKFRLFRDGDEA